MRRGSFGGTISPVTPSSPSVFEPLIDVATAGACEAIASSSVMPKLSLTVEGEQKTSARW
ncbi:hypothetical protein D3C83_317880 [compost metagenome]